MPRPKKLERRIFPDGLKSTDLTYMGRGSIDRDDFESDVGIADMVCIDQFGKVNQSKYYHAGVVKSADSQWFVYLEWGRIFAGKSWISESHHGQDFQFVPCKDEEEARDFFQWQCRDKNTKQLKEKTIGGVKIWVSKSDKKSAYTVQALSTRQKGLPNACNIKDDSGIKIESKKKKITKKRSTKKSSSYQPQIVSLAQTLVSGVQAYAQTAISATGVSPTMAAIERVRNDLIPLAGQRIAKIGDDIEKQLKDRKLIDISTLVATIIPRPLSRGGSARSRQESIILSSNKIATVRQDLDTFEAALNNEDFEQVESGGTDPSDALLGQGCEILWIDPNSSEGMWIEETFQGMTNDRHGYLRERLHIKNIFSIKRPDRDIKFLDYVKKVSKKNSRKHLDMRARLQPSNRNDISDISDMANSANVFLGIHGTRSVNVQPILSSNLRLPKHLPNTQLTGANFGSGIYFATDWRKSYGYTGQSRAYYGSGGQVSGRGFFMFLNDVAMGDAYKARDTGSWSTPPSSKDSIAAYPEFLGYLQNDEHIIFDPDSHRIRYLIEGELT